MKTFTIVGIAALGLLTFSSLSLSQDQPVTGEKSVAFPPSFKCSTNSPCHNLTGEILRIEESYWVRDPDGRETHMKVTRDTKMEEEPKVGDTIAAQLTSKGEANAIVKLAETPKPKELPAPSHAQKDLREKQAESSGGGGNIDPSSKMDEQPIR